MSEDLSHQEVRRELAEWEGFTRHPGWARLVDELDLRLERAVAVVARGGLDVEQYARHGAVIDLCRRVAAIPDERAELLASLLPTEDTE